MHCGRSDTEVECVATTAHILHLVHNNSWHPWVPGFHSQALPEESISPGWRHALPEVKPLAASDRGEAKANEGLLEEHEHLSQEAQVQAVKLELMHIVDWEQALRSPGLVGLPSRMLQVASPQEGHATTKVRYSPQGVPGSGS